MVAVTSQLALVVDLAVSEGDITEESLAELDWICMSVTVTVDTAFIKDDVRRSTVQSVQINTKSGIDTDVSVTLRLELAAPEIGRYRRVSRSREDHVPRRVVVEFTVDKAVECAKVNFVIGLEIDTAVRPPPKVLQNVTFL